MNYGVNLWIFGYFTNSTVVFLNKKNTYGLIEIQPLLWIWGNSGVISFHDS